MIELTECITQDMLERSKANPSKALVNYPRGNTTGSRLGVDNDGNLQLQTGSPDGAWQQATVLSNGNLLFCSDTPDSQPRLVLGANLVMPS